MTTTEKMAIETLLKDIRWPSVKVSEFETRGGALLETWRNADAARLLESGDFKAGWQACRAKVDEVLRLVLTGKPRDVRRYAQ